MTSTTNPTGVLLYDLAEILNELDRRGVGVERTDTLDTEHATIRWDEHYGKWISVFHSEVSAQIVMSEPNP